MLAVIKTGGKQYKVTHGDVLNVEKLEGKPGDVVAIEDVLALIDGAKTELASDKLAKAKVGAEILAQEKGDKVIVFKKKRRQNYRRKNGHRQELTKLRIVDIAADGKIKATAAPAPAPAAKEDAKEEKKAAAKPAAKKADAAEQKPAAAKKPAAKKPAAKKADKADKE